MTFHGSSAAGVVAGEPAFVSVADHDGGAALLEVGERDCVDASTVLVPQAGAAAELDDAVVADVHAVVVVNAAPHLQVHARREPVHDRTLPTRRS
jgi:hypothetical protein